jgi:hypothetical protein
MMMLFDAYDEANIRRVCFFSPLMWDLFDHFWSWFVCLLAPGLESPQEMRDWMLLKLWAWGGVASRCSAGW